MKAKPSRATLPQPLGAVLRSGKPMRGTRPDQPASTFHVKVTQRPDRKCLVARRTQINGYSTANAANLSQTAGKSGMAPPVRAHTLQIARPTRRWRGESLPPHPRRILGQQALLCRLQSCQCSGHRPALFPQRPRPQPRHRPRAPRQLGPGQPAARRRRQGIKRPHRIAARRCAQPAGKIARHAIPPPALPPPGARTGTDRANPATLRAETDPPAPAPHPAAPSAPLGPAPHR